MSRIDLITTSDGLDPARKDLFDSIVASRGKMLRPYEVLLHVPELARKVAELGQIVRYESSLPDGARELAILTVGHALGCQFVWDSHVGLAEGAGVSADAIAAARGEDRPLEAETAAIIGFASGLCRETAVPDEVYETAREHLGEEGTVELAAAVGYYAMLGFVMRATESC